jgi:hypothetical protein
MTINAAFRVAGVVLLAAALLLAAHLSGNSLEFSRYNTGWNGTSQFFSSLDRHRSTEISDPSALASYRNNALLLIIAPGRPPAGQEIGAYRDFLLQGNTIVLADDFGTGKEILRGLGSRISVLPGNLSSVDRAYADSYSVVAYRVANISPVESVSTLVLNRPAPLEGGKPLMATSLISWIDANGDRRINSNEMLGKFSVMAEDEFGRGRLVVLSDPSIFINSMQDLEKNWDNRQLIRTLADHDGPFLVDQMNSRTTDTDGLSGILHVIRTTFIIQVLFVGILMLVAAIAWRKKIA